MLASGVMHEQGLSRRLNDALDCGVFNRALGSDGIKGLLELGSLLVAF